MTRIAKPMGIRVLMLGPGEGVGGGIAALVDTIVPALRRQVDLLYLPTVRHRLLKESGKISLRNIVLALSQYTRFFWALLHFRPHVIHIHTSRGIAWLKDTFFIFFSKACGRHVVLHMHGGNFEELYRKNCRLMQLYTRKFLNLADAVISVSAEMKHGIARIFADERVLLFRNCIAVDGTGNPSSKRSTEGVNALFLGVVGVNKGVFDLIRSMGHLKANHVPLRLWVAGGEEREGDLRRARHQVEELQLEDTCRLIGEVKGERKARLLQEADMLVLPSYHEGLPMAVLEAMAAGLAVVSTRVGGIPEVVGDGYNGFLVTPGDVEALADRLAILAKNPQQCRLMGRRGRERALRELNVRTYVERLIRLYDSLTKGKSASTRSNSLKDRQAEG